MHWISLIRQRNDVFCSFNQSAITSTGATIPFYLQKYQFSSTKKKNRFGQKKIYQTNPTKRQYAFNSIRSTQDFPFVSADRQPMLSFDQITKSKRRKSFLQRLFFTFVCILVLIVLIVVTMILIIGFSWIFDDQNPFIRLMRKKSNDFHHPQVFRNFFFFVKIRDMCKRIHRELFDYQQVIHIHRGIGYRCIRHHKQVDKLCSMDLQFDIFDLESLRTKSKNKPKENKSIRNAFESNKFLFNKRSLKWKIQCVCFVFYVPKKTKNEVMKIFFSIDEIDAVFIVFFRRE